LNFLLDQVKPNRAHLVITLVIDFFHVDVATDRVAVDVVGLLVQVELKQARLLLVAERLVLYFETWLADDHVVLG